MRHFCVLVVVVSRLFANILAWPTLASSSKVDPPFQHCNTARRETLVLTRGPLWSDGNPHRDAVLINGTSPGPLLTFRAGEVAVVRVINGMTNDNTTIHFHGLSQTLNPTSDGTPMVSQWPIVPGNYFEYELHPTDEDVGTTFYHSHVNLQLQTGFGPLIVEESNAKPHTIPANVQDRMMVLSDYFYQQEPDIIAGLLAKPFQWPGSANAVLLNGAGWSSPSACNQTMANLAGMKCSESSYKGPMIVDVGYDQSYRLRWVGATSLMHLAVEIFNHTQTLIAVDGTYIQPLPTTHVELMAGQRYDSLLRSKSKKQVAADGQLGCYYIRIETRWRKPQTNGWAMLRYPDAQCNVTRFGAYPMNNTMNYIEPERFGWIVDQFRPLPGYQPIGPAPSDDQVSRRIYLYSQQTPVSGSTSKMTGIQWSIDGQSYFENAQVLKSGALLGKPYLIALYETNTVAPDYDRAMSAANGNQKGYDPLADVFVGRAGEVIDIIIINNASAVNHQTETHPWHFHSQDHWTMAMGIGNYSQEAYLAARKTFGSPISRDTTGVWPGQGASDANPAVLLPADSSGAWSVLRYRVPADGSATGVWLLHCHWAFHQAMGMATVWAFVPTSSSVVPTASMPYHDPAYLQYYQNVSAPCSHKG